MLSLQLFLFLTVAPFMTLAALVEESKDAEQTLRQRGDRDLNEAQRLAQTGSWQWDPGTDAVTWSSELYSLANLTPSCHRLLLKITNNSSLLRAGIASKQERGEDSENGSAPTSWTWRLYVQTEQEFGLLAKLTAAGMAAVIRSTSGARFKTSRIGSCRKRRSLP